MSDQNLPGDVVCYEPGYTPPTPRFALFNDPTGKPYKWNSMPIPFWTDASCPDILIRAFREACDKWTAVDSRIQFKHSTKILNPSMGGGIIVSFMPNGWINDDHVIAFTRPLVNAAQFGMQIVFNGGAFKFHYGDPWYTYADPAKKPPLKATVDIRLTALHELGHALGLAHSADANSVMYGTIHPGELTPTPDDINGLKLLYP